MKRLVILLFALCSTICTSAVADDADNDVIFSQVRPSTAGLVLSRVLMPGHISFFGLSPEDLGQSMLYGSFEYRNIKLQDGALKVSVYEAGQHLVDYTFVRSHQLQDFDLGVINRQLSNHMTMPVENGELTPEQFFQPIVNECTDGSSSLRKAKVSWQTFFYFFCPNVGSHFFMSRINRGIGVAQTLGGILDFDVPAGTDSGRQNMQITEFVLEDDGKPLSGNPFRLLNHIPVPVETVNYFLSADFDLDEGLLRKKNFEKTVYDDINFLATITEDKWLHDLAFYTDSSMIRDKNGNQVQREQKTAKVSRNGGSIMLKRHATNFVGGGVYYFTDATGKLGAVTSTFTPLLAGYKDVEEVASFLAADPVCYSRKGVIKTEINGLTVFRTKCSRKFGSDKLKKTFLLVPVVQAGHVVNEQTMADKESHEETKALKSFEIIMLLGDLKKEDISDILAAVTLNRSWSWDLQISALSELDEIKLNSIASVSEWLAAYKRDPDKAQAWRSFVANSEVILEGNESASPDVVLSLLSKAAKQTNDELNSNKAENSSKKKESGR